MTDEYQHSITTKGYIYVLYNEMFNYYSPNCFKIGCTSDIQKRKNGYVTSYPGNIEIKYLSPSIDHYKSIEKLVHLNLSQFRLRDRREFFTCDLDHIIQVINDVITNYHIQHNNTIINNNIIDNNIIDISIKDQLNFFKLSIDPYSIFIQPIIDSDEFNLFINNSNSNSILLLHPLAIKHFFCRIFHINPSNLTLEFIQNNIHLIHSQKLYHFINQWNTYDINIILNNLNQLLLDNYHNKHLDIYPLNIKQAKYCLEILLHSDINQIYYPDKISRRGKSWPHRLIINWEKLHSYTMENIDTLNNVFGTSYKVYEFNKSKLNLNYLSKLKKYLNITIKSTCSAYKYYYIKNIIN